MRHRSGLALARTLQPCIVVLRSDGGEVHVLTHTDVQDGQVFAASPADLIKSLSKDNDVGAVWDPFWSDMGSHLGTIWEPSLEHVLKPAASPLLL